MDEETMNVLILQQCVFLFIMSVIAFWGSKNDFLTFYFRICFDRKVNLDGGLGGRK